MTPWAQGKSKVEELIHEGKISRLQGANAGRDALMLRARQQLASAEQLSESDPATAYVVAYDAAKHAALAVLAEQNLRPTATGGHVAIEHTLTAQFQGVFSSFGSLRRRRNELDYPSSDEDFADDTEARAALGKAAAIVNAADELVGRGILTVF